MGYLSFRIVGLEAQGHAVTEVNCPLGGDVDLVCLFVNERQPTAPGVEVSTPEGLQVAAVWFVWRLAPFHIMHRTVLCDTNSAMDLHSLLTRFSLTVTMSA